MRDFSDAVSKWAKKAGLNAEKAMRAAFVDVSGGTVQDTPVKNGYLRANWRCSVTVPAGGTITEADPSGAKTINAIQQFAPNIGGNVVFFTNNLPYARRIEYEGWSKIKAPRGMLNINIDRFVAAANKAAAENKV